MRVDRSFYRGLAYGLLLAVPFWTLFTYLIWRIT